MSDNDLVRRKVLKKQVLEYVRTHVVPTVTGVLALIEDAPAAPREMSAREFLRGFSRMCAAYPAYGNDPGCKGCPLEYDRTCDLMRSELADHFIDVVGKWLKEHPERSEEA